MKDFTRPRTDSFRSAEVRCEMQFRELGQCWHIYTPEKFPLVFGSIEDYRFAMNLIALCALLFPDVKILTFEIMSNHLHIVASGRKEKVRQFFEALREYLGRYLKGISRPLDLSAWVFDPREVSGLEDIRNVIAYVNRNGFLVTPSTTPFSYPWGANRFFFNPELCAFHGLSDGKLSQKEVRLLFHTRSLDRFVGLETVDGYVTPVRFCDIRAAENLFRDALHYFYKVSRDIERQKCIADEIGERIFYTDEELFTLVCSKSSTEFKVDSPSLLPRDAKIQLAKMMRFDYNAGNDQIARMLRLDVSVVDSLFPRY